MALIFFDLDGTTLYRGRPASRVLECIQLLKENNHTIAIATGRSPILLYDKDKELGIDYTVLANGYYVSYKGNVIYERYIPNDVVKRFMDFVDHHKADLVVEYKDRYVAYRKETDISDKFSDLFDIARPKLDDKYYPEENVFAMVVFASDDVIAMKKEFPELEFNLSNEFGYDVNIKGDMKAEGVKALIKHLNIPEDEVYAVGDGLNDLSMIKTVKHGIAMGNASDELKKAANYVTTSVHEDGVYNAMKYYKLI